MAKKEWSDPFPNLPRGGNIMSRIKDSPPAADAKQVDAIKVSGPAAKKPKPARSPAPSKKTKPQGKRK